MNTGIDIPKESLDNEGNLWINERTGQLRYSLVKNQPSKWVVPLSEYRVGDDGVGGAFIKMGQPISVGLIEDLKVTIKDSAYPYIVPTNPSKYQWCIGLALEPGNLTENKSQNLFKQIHILSRGQIEFRLDDTRPNVFQPPNKNDKYLWTYSDIGKPVYVSNHPDDNNGKVGGLTIDITHAYYNGANIISVGRLIDAPFVDQVEQSIIVEVQPSGDVRGMIDSTEFSVELDPLQTFKVFNSFYDRLFCVKIKSNSSGVKYAYIIYDDEILTIDAENTPVGVFLAKSSENGRIDLSVFKNKSVLVHRLGIVTGNFDYRVEDIGKELYLSNGNVTPNNSAIYFEYKVGVLIDQKHVLVDCRFPKFIKKADMIGKIKPAFMDLDTINPPGKIIVEPGYLAIIPGEVHRVLDYSALMQATMYNGIYEYSPNGSFNWQLLDGNFTFNSATPGPNGNIINGYFRFKDVFYSTADGTVISQIKYNQEGVQDAMEYLWPEMTFHYTFTKDTLPQSFFGSNAKFNIDYLVNLGHYVDGQGQNIEDYDITMKVLLAGKTTILGSPYSGDITISPGFYQIQTPSGPKWCGYEWSIQQEGNSVFLKMVTWPGSPEPGAGYIAQSDVWGFCYPVGSQIVTDVDVVIMIRRRPVQHHELFLNQLTSNLMPWLPGAHLDTSGFVNSSGYVDVGGGNLVTDDTLYFGKFLSGDVYTHDKSSRISIKQERGKLSGTNVVYEDTHRIDYSSFFLNNLTPRKTVDQVREIRHPIIESSDNADDYHDIEWLYDFRNNKVNLYSDLAVNLNFLPTTNDMVDSNGKTIKTVEFKEDYIDGRTATNPSGVQLKARSALQTLHEIPIGFFNYVSGNLRIGTTQQQWDSDNGYLEKYVPQNIDRIVFPNASIKANAYQYSSEEWAHIQEEINLIFKPIVRDSLDNITTGGDYQVIQSNIGVLNYAAKETQDRLLKLERMIYGMNTPTMSSTTVIEDWKEKKLGNYVDYITDHGILRLTKELFDKKILLNVLDDQYTYETSGTISYFDDMYLELFGDYETKDEFKNISGNQDGKFHRAYLTFKKIDGQFFEQDESLNPDFTFLSKRHTYSDDYFKYKLPYLKNLNISGIFKDQSVLDNGNYSFFPDQTTIKQLNGEYSAFGFISNKLSTGWSLELSPINFPINVTNQFNISKPNFKFISSENSNLSYDDNIVYNLNNFNKWGVYKDKYNPLFSLLNQENSQNILPDNVIQYRFDSSGLAFDISGISGEAEDINTKFISTVKDQNTVQISGTNHVYVVTYLGEFVFKIDYTKSEFHPENISWNAGSLPSYSISYSTGASGFITSVSLNGGPGSLPSLTVPSTVYVPEKVQVTSGKLWLVDDYSITEDNKAQGFKFSRYITDKDPNKGYISGIAYRPYIKDFKLFGAHIPEKYDMLTKVRVSDHILNQVHLTLKDEPNNYPKEIKNMNKETANYTLFADNKCLVYWNPINIANNFIIMQKEDDYWSTVKYTSTTAFVFDFQKVKVSFKIVSNVFNQPFSISDSDLNLIDEFIIAEIEIPGDATPNDNRTLLEANPEFNYLML